MNNPFIKNFILAQQTELICKSLVPIHKNSDKTLGKIEDAALLLSNGCLVESIRILQDILYSEEFSLETQRTHSEIVARGLQLANDVYAQIGNHFILPYLVGLQIQSFAARQMPLRPNGNPFETFNPFGLAKLPNLEINF